MGFYESIRDENVAAALKEVGSLISCSRTVSAYNPATGGAEGTPETWDRYGLLTSFGVADKMRKGDLIKAGDRRVLLEARDNYTPKPGDFMTIAGEQWQVIGNDPVDPGGVAVLHKVQVRQ